MTELVSLRELMAPKIGAIDPSKYQDEEFDLYSVPAYDEGDPDMTQGKDIGSQKPIVKPGDVLLCRIVPHIRRAWVVREDRGRRIIASGEWIVFRSSRIHAPYLRHLFLGDRFHRQFMNTVAGVGGSLLRARPEFVAKIGIPLPGVEEQRRIADMLDWADELRARRRAAMAKLESLKRSIFLEMFGDPVTNAAGFSTKALGELLERIDSGKSPVCLERPAASGDWGVLKLGAITWGEFDDTQNKALPVNVDAPVAHEVQVGDLLFARKNTKELVGAAAFVYETRPKLLLSDLTFRLRVDKNQIDPVFLQQTLMHPHQRRVVQRLTGGSAGSMPNISKQRLRQVRVPLPPLDVQQTFRARVLRAWQLSKTHTSSATQLQSLFATLQHRAFSSSL